MPALAGVVAEIENSNPKRVWPQCVLILSGVTFVVGAALSAGAEHISMVVLGRLVLGLGVGGGTTVRAQPRSADGCASAFCHVLFLVLAWCRRGWGAWLA